MQTTNLPCLTLVRGRNIDNDEHRTQGVYIEVQDPGRHLHSGAVCSGDYLRCAEGNRPRKGPHEPQVHLRLRLLFHGASAHHFLPGRHDQSHPKAAKDAKSQGEKYGQNYDHPRRHLDLWIFYVHDWILSLRAHQTIAVGHQHSSEPSVPWTKLGRAPTSHRYSTCPRSF